MHDQCRVLWKRCDRILELVFAFDTNKLRLDFKKVGINLYLVYMLINGIVPNDISDGAVKQHIVGEFLIY